MPSDLDLTAEDEIERSSLGNVAGERTAGLVVNSEVVPAVFQTSGNDDDVRISEAKKILCSTKPFASCNDGKRRPELGSLAGMCRAGTKATRYDGSGK
jgi:hypothetical protein